MSSRIRIASPTDKDVIDILMECSRAIEAARTSYLRIGDENLGDFLHSDELRSDFDTSHRSISQAGISFRRSDSVISSGFSIDVSFSRLITSTSGPEPSALFSEFSVSKNGSPNDQERDYYRSVWLTLTRRIATLPPLQVLNTAEGAEAGLGAIGTLQDIHKDLVRDLARQSSLISSMAAEHLASMNQEFEKRRSAQELEVRSQELKLEEERKALLERERALDKRSHMQARRDLRKELSDSLLSRLQKAPLPNSVILFRLLIGSTCILGLGALSVLTAIFSAEASDIIGRAMSAGRSESLASNVALWLLMIKAISAGLTFVAVLFYLLGWLRRTHDTDVRSERDLERYRYDIDRATWIIETVLEIGEKEGTTVPEKWLDAATNSLFARTTDRDSDAEAIDALSALLNMTARAEIGLNGTKLELGRRDLKRIASSHDRARDEAEG